MSLTKPLVFGKPRVEYLKCVYNDPDFIDRARKVHEKIDLGDDNLITLDTVWDSMQAARVPYIGQNPKRKIDDKIIEAILIIEHDFELGSYETVGLLNHEIPVPEEFNGIIYTTDTIDEDEIGPLAKIYVLPGASKRDLIESLSKLDETLKDAYGKKAQLRVKGPQNYQLVYAIHRARRKGKKFSEIFREYGLGELENYSGSRGITSVDKFREYYRRYEPKEPSRKGFILDADSDDFSEALIEIKDIGSSNTPS